MEGITILATNSIYMEPSFWACLGFAIGLAGAIVFAINAFGNPSLVDTVETIVLQQYFQHQEY